MSKSTSAMLATGLFLAFVRPALADEPKTDSKPAVRKSTATQFVRIAKDNGEPAALETAVVRYKQAVKDSDISIDLIGVVHIGEAAYYRKLNRLMSEYDVVLYELVAPQGTVIPKGGRNSDNPVSIIQKATTLFLALDLQTEHIDYTRKNFVHADLSPTEMKEAMKKRGDDGVTIALSALADMLRQQNLMELQKKQNPGKVEEPPDILSLLTDSMGPSKLKRMLAGQLATMETDGTLGKTLTTMLVDDRNAAAMKVLHKQLAAGKKKIAIFYGAAHMPDFERRLRAELNFVPTGTQWLEAWDLNLREVGLADLLRLLGP